jgi:hypothetical protein
MNNIDAFFMTIQTLFFLYIGYHLARFLTSTQLLVVMAYIEQEVELKLTDYIYVPWLLMNNYEILNNAIQAINNKESVAEQIFNVFEDDDEDDDGDLAVYREDLVKT